MSGIHILPIIADHCIVNDGVVRNLFKSILLKPRLKFAGLGLVTKSGGRLFHGRTTLQEKKERLNDLWISAARWFALLTISKMWLLNFNWGSMIIPRSLMKTGEVKIEVPIKKGWCCDIPRSRMTLFELDIPICHRIDHAYRESRLDWKFVAELVSEISVYNSRSSAKSSILHDEGSNRSAKSLIKSLKKDWPEDAALRDANGDLTWVRCACAELNWLTSASEECFDP